MLVVVELLPPRQRALVLRADAGASLAWPAAAGWTMRTG